MSRLKLIGAIALSLALVGGLALSLLSDGETTSSGTATTPDARSKFFGITQGIRLDAQDLQTMAATGVGEDRVQFIWGSVQPARGAFNWTPTDALVGSLAAHGIRTVPFIWGSPSWVAPTTARPPLDGVDAVQAWEDFLRAAVVRYGPGGSYWATVYRQQYGANAKPLPIQSWQIWNEPNLKKYFAPRPSVEEYAQLLRISHEAIRTEDAEAQVVLAGMPGYGNRNAWDFLDRLYSTPGIRNSFDAVALHPYAPNVDQLRLGVEKVREVIKDNGDQSTPMWITELGWGSAPPDRFGLNKGLDGQRQLLSDSFKLILSNRKAWNVQRVFWFDWRDPANPDVVRCSFCATAGLLKSDRTPKPAYHVFKLFARAR
jgi:polysaccharide biosynthesis protein PslG